MVITGPDWRDPGAPVGSSWATLPTPSASHCPGSPVQPGIPGAPAEPPRSAQCVPRSIPMFCWGSASPHSQANHCHHLPPHMVIAGIKELSSKTTLNCVNERVRKREVEKSKIMASGDKVPLLGAMKKVTSLNSHHPLIQERSFCNYHVFSLPPPRRHVD